MQHPKCRTCGDRHPIGPCPMFMSSGPTDKAKAREVVSDAGERSAAPRRSEPSRGGKRVVEPPKTGAERQRRYREKHGDEYRKREAARQRRRRQELKDG